MGNSYNFCKCENSELTEYALTLKRKKIINSNDDIVNYQSEKQNYISSSDFEQYNITTKYKSKDSNKIEIDNTWNRFDISFLINDKTYIEKNDSEILYSEEFDLKQPISDSNSNIFKESINVKCVITKKHFALYKWISILSSVIVNSNNSYDNYKVYTDPLFKNIKPLVSFFFSEIKIISLNKYKSFDLSKNPFIEIIYQRVNNETKYIIVLSSPINSKLNFVIQMVSFLSKC